MNAQLPPWPADDETETRTYVETRLTELEAAFDDTAQFGRVLGEISAEGPPQLGEGLTDSLVLTGMTRLAERTPARSQEAQEARRAFLAAVRAHEGTITPQQWGTGPERLYRLCSAALLGLLYAENPDDELMQTGAEFTAHRLIRFDIEYSTGRTTPPRFDSPAEQAHRYVQQEWAALDPREGENP